MRPMRHTLVLLALSLVALALPALAHASPNAVIRDCADDGTLQGKYSNGDLRRAQQTLPADLDEYSDCREVIGAAITSGPGGKGGKRGGQGGGPALSAAAKRRAEARDRAALAAITRGDKRPELGIGGKTIKPGPNGLFDVPTASSGLPLPLILALIGVGLLATGGLLYVLRQRVAALARLSLPRISLPRVPLPRLRR
jgi:hypothetical protein